MMINKRIFTTAAMILLAAATANAMDSIKTVNGTSVSGKVTKIDWDKVEIEQGIGENKSMKEVPANQIVTIYFDSGHPPVKKALDSARKDIAEKKQYAEGLKSLAKIKPDEINSPELKQDYEFYAALANAKLFFGGEEKIQDVRKAMLDFVQGNPNSYHLLEASEILGDLLVAEGSYVQAEGYYGKLAKTSWPETKMKAGVLIGRTQLKQNKFEEAEKSFQSVLNNMDIKGREADELRLAALLGKANVLVGLDKAKEAVEMLNQIIQKHDSEDAEPMAYAYNALGNAYRKLGNPNEAKFAYLHTDQLYSSVPDAHAEALANLVEIWTELRKPERAVEARRTLEKLYKNSPWAKGESK
jgi:tetratricopeptide (TPR) repeat protein